MNSQTSAACLLKDNKLDSTWRKPHTVHIIQQRCTVRKLEIFVHLKWADISQECYHSCRLTIHNRSTEFLQWKVCFYHGKTHVVKGVNTFSSILVIYSVIFGETNCFSCVELLKISWFGYFIKKPSKVCEFCLKTNNSSGAPVLLAMTLYGFSWKCNANICSSFVLTGFVASGPHKSQTRP